MFIGFHETDPLNGQYKTSNNVVLEDGKLATLTCMAKPFHSFSIIWENVPESRTSRFREMKNGFLEIHRVKKTDSMSLSCSIPYDKSVSIRRTIRTTVVESSK